MIRIQITAGDGAEGESRWLAGLNRAVNFIQVREREATTRDLARLVRVAMKAGPVLVNDRADVAIACEAAGVHLRAGSVSAAAIKLLGPLIVTVSCHSLADIEAAAGADYVLLAPVFPPLSKADLRTPLGLDALREICSATQIPVIALGGITADNAQKCIEAGAAGVAGITLFRT